MPPKRRIPAVERKEKSKKIKTYASTLALTQTTLPFPVKPRTREDKVATDAVVKELWPDVVATAAPDPLAWYKSLSLEHKDPEWFKEPGYEYKKINKQQLDSWVHVDDHYISNRPCPDLPNEMWCEIITQVCLLYFLLHSIKNITLPYYTYADGIESVYDYALLLGCISRKFVIFLKPILCGSKSGRSYRFPDYDDYPTL